MNDAEAAAVLSLFVYMHGADMPTLDGTVFSFLNMPRSNITVLACGMTTGRCGDLNIVEDPKLARETERQIRDRIAIGRRAAETTAQTMQTIQAQQQSRARARTELISFTQHPATRAVMDEPEMRANFVKPMQRAYDADDFCNIYHPFYDRMYTVLGAQPSETKAIGIRVLDSRVSPGSPAVPIAPGTTFLDTALFQRAAAEISPEDLKMAKEVLAVWRQRRIITLDMLSLLASILGYTHLDVYEMSCCAPTRPISAEQLAVVHAQEALTKERRQLPLESGGGRRRDRQTRKSGQKRAKGRQRHRTRVRAQVRSRAPPLLTQLLHQVASGLKWANAVPSAQFEIQMTVLNRGSSVPAPRDFPLSSIPAPIWQHIRNTARQMCTVVFHGAPLKQQITFYFVSETPHTRAEYYLARTRIALAWLWCVQRATATSRRPPCGGNHLTVWLYWTALKKKLPAQRGEAIGEEHVNTAFTRTCPFSRGGSEIVLFRREEWFKVFIHETFHYYGLDFSNRTAAELQPVHQRILRIFPVASKVNLYESYSETWARILNTLFVIVSAAAAPSSRIRDSAIAALDTEARHSAAMSARVQAHFGTAPWRETTSVLSYYVIAGVLMQSWRSFLDWCAHQNGAGAGGLQAIVFLKKKSIVNAYCDLIAQCTAVAANLPLVVPPSLSLRMAIHSMDSDEG